jgi:hypothetical protein
MKPTWLVLLGAFIVAGPGDSRAQPPTPVGPVRPPAFSPYLNMLRSGTPAINYYGLVRPEIQFRQSINNLATDVAANQQAIGQFNTALGVTRGTGHPTQFMNLGGYFMNSGPTGSVNRSAGVPQPRR